MRAIRTSSDGANDGASEHCKNSDPKSEVVGFAEGKTENAHRRSRGRVYSDWPARDSWLKVMVDFGLSAIQIARLSEAWARPLRTHQQVYEQFRRLRLRPLYRRRASRRVSQHSRVLVFCFMKLAYLLKRSGHEMWRIFREYPMANGLIPDFGFRIDDKRQFFVEVQVSSMGVVKWEFKLLQFLDLYLTEKKPFRVLLIVNGDIDDALTAANAVLHDRPKLNLFLMISMKDFQASSDLLRSGWINHRREAIGLE